jgi:hypothetical protein
LLKETVRLFALGLLFWTFAFDLGLFAFGFLMGKAFWM